MDDLTQFMELFLQTSTEHIHKLNELLNKYSSAVSQETLEEIHLHLHSLKGEILIMNYPLLGKFVTLMEDYVKNVKNSKKQLTNTDIQIILDVVREISATIEIISSRQNEPADLQEKTNLLKQKLNLNHE